MEVKFSFEAKSLGSAVIQFTALAADGGSDGVEVSFDVVGVALPARLATSFAGQASDAGSGSAEGLALPAALPGSASLNIDAGVGRLPSVLAIARRVLQASRNQVCFRWRRNRACYNFAGAGQVPRHNAKG